MNKPYTEKERSSVVNRYPNGEKISDISQKTNISRGTIYAWIKQRQESFGEKEIPNYRDLHFLSQKCNRQKDMIDILRASDCSVNSPLRDKFNETYCSRQPFFANIYRYHKYSFNCSERTDKSAVLDFSPFSILPKT